MEEPPLKLVAEIGTQLGRPARPNKDFLVKSLRQAATALSQIEQSSSLHEESKKAESMKRLEVAIRPLTKSIIKHGLLRHNDKDVKLLVAICVSEMFRVLAPEPPFEDKYLRDIFKLILSMFAELADTTSPYFSRRVKILETVAQCKCFVVMLDIDCNDLVLEMFNIFFSIVRENHQATLIDDLLSIMTHILHEEASQALSDVILRNLIKEGKAASSAASQLAVSVIKSCAEKLEPFICGFLTSCSLDRDAVESELKEFYHEILFKVFQCAPEMLLAVIPNLIQELLTDQVDVRIKAVNLSGKLFAMPEQHVAQKYHNLFIEFKNRFSDKSVEVRLSALQSAKACYMANPSGKESSELLSAIEGRLLDFDDRVRTLAVVVVCDLARFNMNFFSPELISKATERLRDKKLSVRKKAFQKLIEVYQEYCNKCSEGYLTMDDHFERIPCKILMLCYDKDCKEFRSHNMELILAESLFPVCLSAENRTKHWIHFSSLFTPLHVKALNSILSQKRRLQIEMQSYLALRKKQKDNSSEEMQMRNKFSFLKMSAFFPDPSKAEEGFHKLNQMKDNNLFNMLELLLVDQTSINAQTTRDKFLKMIGDKHPQFEFLQQLSSKCSFNIFSLENVSCILDRLSSRVSGNEHLEASSAKLLLAIVSFFPSLLRGSEEQFRMLLVENPTDDVLIEILAKASSHISVKFRDFYPFLERVCKEGTRIQSKHAVKAIASLTSEQFVLSELCKELVDSLNKGWNVPTILQSLGCIAQHSVSAFEAHEREINSYIFNRIFQVQQSDLSSDVTSECSHSCKLKIYGLKTLVKSFLPFRGSHVNRQIDDLLGVVLKFLQVGDYFDGIICASDLPHIRLAAAKSVLRLSRKWDPYVSPEIFRRTVLMVKDSSSSVRGLFLNKTHKLLKEHSLPIRYACVFALAASDLSKDLQDTSCKYLEEFIKDYSTKAGNPQISAVQEGSFTNYPAYIVVFLIHVLAHNDGFPPEDCEDEKAYTYFCSPLFWVVRALLNAHVVNGNMDLVNDTAVYLLSIFSAIKKAEDAEDATQTLKLQILAEIGTGIVFALNHDCNSSSRSSSAPERIFLPASLYKLSSVKKSDKENLKVPSQSFFKRVVDGLRSQVSMPASSLPKRGRKCQEGGLQSGNYMRLNLTSCKNANISRNETTERQKPSSQDINLVQNVVKRVPAFEENSRVDSPVTGESSKHSAGKVNEQCCARVCSTKNDALIGKRIKIFSPIDRCFCSGTVVAFDPAKSVHKISYDSGDVELLCLDSESWETIGETSPTEKTLSSQEMKLADEAKTFHSTDCTAEETVDRTGDGVVVLSKEVTNKEKEKFHKGKTSIPAKRKKVQKLSSDASASEVVNVNEEPLVRRSKRIRKV
ncbi:sister chromatid cohesion protein PDS5 homolog B [Euphorbia lathyris]|uniref:sister chromatid cohesion protein PDS5 homolog B n=1 Tax=Euphorbia lathyris TaxID=212925 RepID=UPI0033144D20